MSYDSAQTLAEQLRSALAPGCERIEVAGSIRRGKPNPKDIELVAIAQVIASPILDMFGTPVGSNDENRLDAQLAHLLGAGEWQFDQTLKRNGPKYKRLVHLNSDICCDLFITTADSWGVIFTIRTGPGDFSKAMVTRALNMGMKVDESRLWRVHRDDSRTPISTPTERDFFAALRVPYLEPAERTMQAFQLALMARRP